MEAPSLRAPRAALREESAGGFRLKLAGRFPPGWCGNLAAGLARAGIAIESGRALSSAARGWRAELCLRAPGCGADPRQLDFGQLLETDAGAGFTTPIALLASRVGSSPRHGGCLTLAIEGEDRVGFLAALLRRLAYLSLFPVELELETRGGVAADLLWLRGAGGRQPCAGAARSLAASLGALVRRPT
jgi:hypothetical protein